MARGHGFDPLKAKKELTFCNDGLGTVFILVRVYSFWASAGESKNLGTVLERETMTKHMTGTREEWLAARLELLKAEKELTRRSDELAQRRQEQIGKASCRERV